MTTKDSFTPAPAGRCPICNASDAYIDQLGDRDDVFVECVNCRVYVATRKAFRHFEYLRWRLDPAGLRKLDRLASYLKHHPTEATIRLDYDTWESLTDELAR